MKTFLLRQLASTSFAVAAVIGFSAPLAFSADEAGEAAVEKANKLAPGDQVPSFTTEGMSWIQGEEIKSLDEKGKVYMIECWATWCGPCIASIPHINELHQKYADKGLVIVGMNVWEDGLDKVQKFVTDQGEGMSYRVAYSGGKESAFTDTWLKAAGVRGIPHAFLVKDGKLIATSHPASITNSMVESMLSPDFDPKAFAAEQAAAEKRKAELQAKIRPFYQNGDWDGMREFAKTELNEEADADMRTNLLRTAAMNLGDWPEIQAIADEATSDKAKRQTLGQAGWSAPMGDGAKEFATGALAVFTAESVDNQESLQGKLMDGLIRTRFLTMAGQKDEAEVQLTKLKTLELKDERSKATFEKALENATKGLEGDAPLGPIQKLMR